MENSFWSILVRCTAFNDEGATNGKDHYLSDVCGRLYTRSVNPLKSGTWARKHDAERIQNINIEARYHNTQDEIICHSSFFNLRLGFAKALWNVSNHDGDDLKLPQFTHFNGLWWLRYYFRWCWLGSDTWRNIVTWISKCLWRRQTRLAISGDYYNGNQNGWSRAQSQGSTDANLAAFKRRRSRGRLVLIGLILVFALPAIIAKICIRAELVHLAAVMTGSWWGVSWAKGDSTRFWADQCRWRRRRVVGGVHCANGLR